MVRFVNRSIAMIGVMNVNNMNNKLSSLKGAFSLYFLFCIALTSCAPGSSSRTSDGGDTDGQTFRVMAYNIHHSNPPDKPDVIDIDGIARAIRAEDPDLVALQEVDVNTARSGQFNQAQEIAKILDMEYFFARAIDYQGGEYGVAILSKFPIDETVIHRLPSQPEPKSEPRILATARVRLPGGIFLRFGSTHLDANRESVNREMQAEEILRIVEEETLPLIIGGDFNAVPDSKTMTELARAFKSTCEECPFTSSAANPRRTIDYILYRDPANILTVEGHHVVNEKKASDHLPIVADFKVSVKP